MKYRVTITSVDWNQETTYLDFTQEWEAKEYAALNRGRMNRVTIKKVQA